MSFFLPSIQGNLDTQVNGLFKVPIYGWRGYHQKPHLLGSDTMLFRTHQLWSLFCHSRKTLNPSRAGWDHVEIKFLCIRHSSSFIHSGAQLTFDKWMNTPMQYSVCKSWLSYSWDDWLPLVEKRRSLEYHLLNVDSCLAVDQPPQHSSDPYEALSFLLSHLILPTPFK